ncbi:MAG: hypothetical protein JWL99_777 [Streptomyces oryziradicis]|nr:hypothetical protein [Actinacidiphila oryziradicis]
MRVSRTYRPAVLRTAAGWFIASAMAVTPLVAAPAAFAANADVTSVSTYGDGTLSVGLNDGDALWIKISVRASATADAPVLASTDALHYDSVRGWLTEQPISLPSGTGYGDYPVDVDYRLPGGTVQHWAGADHGTSGLLDYRLHTSVTAVSFDRDHTDFDNRTAVLNGTVTTFDPATAISRPADAGTQVRVDWPSGAVSTATTVTTAGATGAFAAPVTAKGALSGGGDAVVVGAGPDTTVAEGTSLPALPAETTRYRISADPSATRVHKGTTFTVGGTVQRLTADGWKPFAAAPVVTTTGTPDTTGYTTPGLLGSGTSDSTGTFSYKATVTTSTYHRTYVKPSAYLENSPYAENYVHVPTAGSISGLTASIDQYGQVKASGKLGGACIDEPVALQYSKNGKTGWSTLVKGTVGYPSSGKCAFSLTAWGYIDGYYRVSHAETDAMLAVNSATKRLHRTDTRFTSFDMTPHNPKASAKFVATGKLQYKSGSTWKGYKGANLVLVFKPKGDNTWYWVVKGKSGANGSFTFKGDQYGYYGDGTWAVYLNADSTHFYSESKTVYVNVR